MTKKIKIYSPFFPSAVLLLLLGIVLGSGQVAQAQKAVHLSLGPAILVAQAPQDKPQPHWGPWQFPRIERLADGRLHVSWKITSDSVRTYGRPRGNAVSDDNGKTWNRISPAQAGKLRGGFVMPNGDRLRLMQESPYPVNKVKLPAPVSRKNALVIGRITRSYQYYLRSDFSGPVLLAYPQMRLSAGSSTWKREYPKVNIPGQLFWRIGGVLVRPFFIGMGQIIQAPDGSLWASCYWPRQKNGRLTGYIPTYVHSADNGRVWNFVSDLPYQPDKSKDKHWKRQWGFCEAALAIEPDGSMITLVRSGGPSYLARSTDKGKHWSRPVVFAPFGVKPALLVLKNGVTLASYGRPGVHIRASSDPAGLKWGPPINVPLHRPGKTCAYTQMIAIGPNQALLAYSDFDYPDGVGQPRKAICVRQITATIKEHQ